MIRRVQLRPIYGANLLLSLSLLFYHTKQFVMMTKMPIDNLLLKPKYYDNEKAIIYIRWHIFVDISQGDVGKKLIFFLQRPLLTEERWWARLQFLNSNWFHKYANSNVMSFYMRSPIIALAFGGHISHQQQDTFYRWRRPFDNYAPAAFQQPDSPFIFHTANSQCTEYRWPLLPFCHLYI